MSGGREKTANAVNIKEKNHNISHCIQSEMMSESISCFAFFFLVVSIFADEEIHIDIPQGSLKGIKSKTILNQKPLYSFTGIPYAKTIDGSNKFKAAEPPEAWSGVYDATRQGSRCVSFCMIKQKIVGEDNCLFINVYTPEPNKEARRAVMVWIYGGSFNMGTADRDFFGPDFLVEQDVLLVTFNYRLGAFGFIGTEDSASPGNVGLKDQNAALKWVKDNIQYFGGRPDGVTIFGQSAGGASVQYHMMSPMSAGLFQRAISQGGSTGSSWAITYHPREAAFKLGKALGIETTDSTELIEALGQLPSYKIVEAAMTVDKTENGMNGHWYAFIPCVEPDVGQEVFLSEDPLELIKKGQIIDVPYMAGLNLNDTLFLKKTLQMADTMNEHFENFLPDNLNATDPAERKRIANKLRSFYLDGKPLTRDSVQEYTQMTMDIMFTSGVQILLTIINSLKSSPTYNYLFTYDSPFGSTKVFTHFDGEKGVLHGDELRYIFLHAFHETLPEPGSTEEKVTRLMSKLWANFAKTGNPTPTLDDDITSIWEPMGNDHNYAIINEELTIEKNIFKERVDFWVSIYKDDIRDYIDLF